MITTLEKAKQMLGIIDDSNNTVISDKLKSLEITVRNLTNNKFLDAKVRFRDGFLFQNNKITGASFDLYGFRKDNTIEIVDSILNDGLYTIIEVDNTGIIVDRALEYEQSSNTMVTKVAYPYDIVSGVIKLIKYDFKMGDKIGIKSEAISRHSVTYYDVNSTESVEGYPSVLMKFLDKYKKLRW